ncbi:MAG: hypothetical protein ACLQBX_04935, partial [Candidatus Limnocylindrales bacterium]
VEPLGEREAAGVRCGSRSKARHLVGTAGSMHEMPCPEVQQRLRPTGQEVSAFCRPSMDEKGPGSCGFRSGGRTWQRVVSARATLP